MTNALRTDKKLTTADFATAGTGRGLNIDVSNHAGVGLNMFDIRVRATSASAVSEIALGVSVPNRAVVLGHTIYSVTGQTLATGTHTSLGYAADPDWLGEHADATLDDDDDEVISAYATPVVATAERALQIASTNGSGADAGTLVGDYLIHVWGFIPAAVDPDA